MEEKMNSRDDRILPFTRAVAVIVVPFLWLAFLILFFYPDSSGERFAWSIKPHMTALYMGAGYFGGSWLFINAIFGKRWHRIQGGFLPITTFTWFMMIATFLYWDRFVHENLGFILWLVLYVVTPFLVPVIWFVNRKTDPKEPEEKDAVIPSTVRWIPKLFSAFILIFVVAGIVKPALIIQIWPWKLSPLTELVMCGWISLLGMGGFIMSNESRWSGWKVPLESITVWHVLVLIGAAMNISDFTNGIVNWYTVSVLIMLVAIITLYLIMENQRSKPSYNEDAMAVKDNPPSSSAIF
jgi:hypothetical protein